MNILVFCPTDPRLEECGVVVALSRPIGRTVNKKKVIALSSLS
jgi:hypothetical protein